MRVGWEWGGRCDEEMTMGWMMRAGWRPMGRGKREGEAETRTRWPLCVRLLHCTPTTAQSTHGLQLSCSVSAQLRSPPDLSSTPPASAEAVSSRAESYRQAIDLSRRQHRRPLTQHHLPHHVSCLSSLCAELSLPATRCELRVAALQWGASTLLRMASTTTSADTASAAALTAWRERTAHQLQAKLRRTQPHLSLSHVQHALQCIEQTLSQALQPSASPLSHPIPLHSIDLPTLLSLQSSVYPFYSDIDYLSNPTHHLTNREVAFASSFPSPSPSLRLLTAQPRLLVGRLSTDAANPQRLLLIDDTATIPCHVIHADVALLDRVVLFLRWSLLLTSARPVAETVLEIDASQAALLPFSASPFLSASPSPPSSSQLYPLHQLTHRHLKRLSASSRSSSSSRTARAGGHSLTVTSPLCPPALEPPLRPMLHIRGVVVAKSPMVQRRDGVFHFVEVAASPAASPSVFLLFNGAASVRCYHVLHVDEEYVFANVRAKALQAGGQVKFVLLASAVAATPSPSHHNHGPPANVQLFSARSSRLPVNPLPSTTPCPSVHDEVRPSSARPTPHRCSRTVSYVGMITKQVAVCVYELDHNQPALPRSSSSLPASSSASPAHNDPLTSRFPVLRLYLTRYDCGALHDGLGLRPGCVVQLHHVHRLYHSGCFLGLGCCARSQVSVVSFSPLSAVCRPLRRDGEQRLLWSAFQRLNLPDTALFVDVMESLTRKWGRGCRRQLLAGDVAGSPGLLRRLLHDRLQWGCTDDLYQQVMEHDTACLIAAPSAHSASPFPDKSYPCFLSLSALFVLPAVSRAFERLRRRLRQDDHSSTAWHSERIPYSTLTQPGLVFTGYLSSSLSTYTSRAYTVAAPAIVIDADDPSPVPDVSSVYTGLHLTDSASSTAFAVDCIVFGGCGGEQLDGCYQLTDFELVLETVTSPAGMDLITASASASPASTNPAPHVVAYLLLSSSALNPLISPPGPPSSSATLFPGVAETSLTLFVTHRLTRIVPAVSARASLTQLSSLPSGSAPCDPGKGVDDVLHAARASSARCTQTVECSLRALLITSATTQPRRIHVTLKGDALSCTPLIHSGQVIHLSSCHRTRRQAPADADEDCYDTTPTCSLSIDSSPAASEWAQRMQQHIPPCSSVAQLLVCDISVFGEGRVDPTPCSFTGEVIDKQFRCDPLAQRQEEGVRRSHSAPTHSLSTSSCTLSLAGRWCVRLRDVRLAHTVEVYASMSSRVFPAGVVPGAVVRVSGAVRKLSPAWKLFVECTAQSELSVLSARPAYELSSAPMPPTVALSTFSLIPLTLQQWLYRVRCRVTQVKRLRVSVQCLFCARVVASTVKESDRSQFAGRWRSRDGRCGLTSCRRLQLRLSAQLLVDDGTASALALVEGPVVWDVLGLSKRHVDLVKQLVAELGEVDYSDHPQTSASYQAQRKRKRGRGQWDGDDDVGGASSEDEAALLEPDYAALKSARLCELFREMPRGRCVALQVQQLVLSREVEAYRGWARRRKGEGVRAAESREEAELDLLLSSAVTSEMKVGGESHAMEKPAGWLTFRVLHCEPVRAADEVRDLLTHSGADG